MESLDWREPGLKITFSGGLVASGEIAHGKTLLAVADAEVYHAKRDGKNRIYLGSLHETVAEKGIPPNDSVLSNEEA